MNEFKCLTEETIFRFFSDETLCREYLTFRRWKGTVRCPHCTYGDAYAYSDGRKYRCKNRFCKKLFTVTTGTIFHRTKQPLKLWFRAIYEVISNPSKYTAHGMWVKFRDSYIGMRYETAYFMRQRIMELFRVDYSKVRKLDGTYEFDGLYSGPDLTMMIAERRQNHANTAGLSHMVCISAIVNRGKGIYGMVMPYNTNKQQEQRFIKSIIPKKATAYSDSSSLYRGLNKYISNYQRFNHSKGQYGKGSAHTNTLGGISNQWRIVESNFQYISHKYLQRYWDEFCFKYNCGYNGLTTISQQFEYVLGNMDRPLTYEKLKEHGKEKEVELRQNKKVPRKKQPIAKSCPRIAITKSAGKV